MRNRAFCVLLLVVASVAYAQSCLINGPTPCYSAAGVVNSADYQAGELAPGAIGSIFGTGLSYTTRGILPTDIGGGMMPTELEGTGVHVLVGNIPAGIFYVSPKQINFQVPNILIPTTVNVQVVLDGNAGPPVAVTLKPAAPALYQVNPSTVIATRPDGSLYTNSSPARAGDWVILYATGLGGTLPPLNNLEIPHAAADIQQQGLQVLLNSIPVDRDHIAYAGVAPGFAGLYQINLQLPASFPSNPQIQVVLSGSTSASGVILSATP